jgi:hypothetical protein
MAGLRAAVAGGTLTRLTLVWRPGMPAWTVAEAVSEVAAVLSQAPPPLPPQ